MYQYNYEDELRHYGVLGMKWGVRRTRRKDAKANYRKSVDKAFSKYEREINSIEKGYKRGQTLSKKDQAREAKADADYQKATSKAKAAYKLAKTDKSNDAAIANKLYSKQNKKANDAIANMSMGKAMLQSYVLGSYGALKYNEAKARGAGKASAAIEGLLYQMGDTMFSKIPSTVDYLDNRAARK